MHQKTAKEAVIEECRRISALATALAEASDRCFSAPADEPDFETTDGPDYAWGLRRLRIHLERCALLTEGIDADLDVALHKISMDNIRANPREARPALFQIN